MTLALIGTAMLAILVFAFVLEPLLRAHTDEIVVDAIAFPDLPDNSDDAGPDADEAAEAPRPIEDERMTPGRVIDQPAGGELT